MDCTDTKHTIHQLSKEEFDNLLISVKGQKKSSLKGQAIFEKEVLKRGWRFQRSYYYINTSTKVNLVCSNKHLCYIKPSNFNVGKGCKTCLIEKGKEEFEQHVLRRGWVLGEDYTYKNSGTKVSLVCSKGHCVTLAPSKFKSGTGCSVCACNSIDKAKIDFQNLLDDLGWSFDVNQKYINRKTKIGLVCDKGHHIEVTPRHLKDYKICTLCTSDGRKHHFEKEVVVAGWGFCKDYEYRNTYTSVKLLCREGHEVNISPSRFRQNKGCMKCRTYKSQKVFENLVVSSGWVFSEKYYYTDTITKVQLYCSEGHLCEITPASFKSGTRCNECAFNNQARAKRDFEDAVRDRGWKFGKDYLYQGVFVKVPLVCVNEHICHIRPHSFKGGTGCPKCTKYGYDPSLPACFYVQSLSDNGIILGYKIGITNRDPFVRMREQSGKSRFLHDLVKIVYSDNGGCILSLERKIKDEVVLNYFSKKDVTDGYTETLSPLNLEKVFEILDDFSS